MAKYLTTDNQGEDYYEIPIKESTGAASANKIPQTKEDGKLDVSLMPPELDLSAETATTSEALAAGDFINVWLDSSDSTVKIRKGDAGNNRPYHGFVRTSYPVGVEATYFSGGDNTELSDLVPGSPYFASETPGTASPTIPLENDDFKPNTFIQNLGIAINTTTLRFEYNSPRYMRAAA